MSYSRTIINGTSVSQEGGPSFDQELEDLQDQIDGIGSGSVPTGTGLRHVTSGVEDPTAYSLSAADIRTALFYGTTSGGTGTPNAYTTTATPSATEGTAVWIRFNAANTTTATLNGVAVVKNGVSGTLALAGAEIQADSMLLLVYSSAATAWVLAGQRGILAAEALAGFGGTKDASTVPNGAGAMAQGVSGSWSAAAFVSPNASSGAVLRPSTSDGSDNQFAALAGGGTVSQTRGADVRAYGNEHANSGQAWLVPGDAGWISLLNSSGIEAFRFVGGELRIHSNNTVGGSSTERNIAPVNGSGIHLQYNVPAGGQHRIAVAGTEVANYQSTGLQVTGSLVATGAISTSSGSGLLTNLVRSNSGSPLTLAANTTDGADSQYVAICNRAAATPGTSQTGGACIFLYGNENAGTGIIELCPGEAGGVRIRKFNGSVGTQVDGTGLQSYGTGVSVPTGGTWVTIATLAATQSSYHVQVDAFGSIILDFDGTTLTALVAAPNLLVAGSAGGSQIAFRANGTSLQASNGTGTSRSASCPIRSNR